MSRDVTEFHLHTRLVNTGLATSTMKSRMDCPFSESPITFAFRISRYIQVDTDLMDVDDLVCHRAHTFLQSP